MICVYRDNDNPYYNYRFYRVVIARLTPALFCDSVPIVICLKSIVTSEMKVKNAASSSSS